MDWEALGRKVRRSALKVRRNAPTDFKRFELDSHYKLLY
jgi:hypothetical protein